MQGVIYVRIWMFVGFAGTLNLALCERRALAPLLALDMRWMVVDDCRWADRSTSWPTSDMGQDLAQNQPRSWTLLLWNVTLRRSISSQFWSSSPLDRIPLSATIPHHEL